MKTKFQNFKLFWKNLRKHWSNSFHIIIRNERNLSDVFKFRLSPRRIFVVATIAFLLITILTVALIAFTPLRVYVPGYTNPVEYQLYKKMLTRVDSVERMNAMQKVYLDNFYNVLNDLVIYEDMNAPEESVAEKRLKNKGKTEEAAQQVSEAADLLWIEIAERNTKHFVPLAIQPVSTHTFTFTMPALGVITRQFSIEEQHFGTDIENEKGTLITAIADGVVIGTENSEKEGNILIIQHAGNMVSIYKNIDVSFKKTGAKVKSGDPIATMGNRGTESKNPYLHFEIWYNGTAINPVRYFLGN
jgi:murein DD-endopeptidase MepM/ murein hydrolase activator NlpD